VERQMLKATQENASNKAAALEKLLAKHSNTLAHEIAETLFQYGGRKKIENLTFTLQERLRQVRPYLDPVVLTDLQNAKQSCGPVVQAYGLGQLAFAQLLAANATSKNADDNFEELLKGKKYTEYIKYMLEGERTSFELKELCGEREETVSRKLKELREIGASDFRRDGRGVINFLTPIAKEVAQTLFSDSSKEVDIGKVAVEIKNWKFDRHDQSEGVVKDVFGDPLEVHMQSLPSMGEKNAPRLVHA
jgi:DNA-binding transcriptional ArsR family regulator